MKNSFGLIAVCMFALQISESSGNSGTNFIMSFANNKYSSKAYDIDIYLSAAVNHDVAINVSAPKFQDFDINFSFSLTPGTSKHLNIDDKFRMPAGTGISPRTLVITASDLIDVVGVNLYASNGDAFLAIPDRYLGNEYMAVTYIPSSSTAASFLTVSAGTGSDVTLLSITFPRWTGNEQVPMNGTLYGAGEVARVSLMSLETLQIQTNYDLTGTFVKSDHPVSVYSGVNRTSVYSTTCLSQLLDQMPPVDRAGKSYVTVPFPKRDIGDLYRIVATDDDTVLSVPNSVSVNLTRRGDFHETYVSANTFYYVTATKPVVVAQISVSRTSSSDKYGDPSLVILTPTEGAYGNASFSRASYPNSFVTIVMLKQDQAGIRFDHEPLPANQEWFLVEGNASYTATQVLVGSSDTPRTIYHSGGAKFVAYFHTGTTCEAQAMSLGLSLPVINDPCKVSISEPGDGLDNDCDGHVDEEACCLNIDIADNDGDGRFNEDCVGVSGNDSSRHVCCDSSGNVYGCRPISASVLFGEMKVGRRIIATSVIEHWMYTETACIMACLQQDTCWGTNFNPTPSFTGSGISNCEILAGTKESIQEDSLWSFRGVSKRIVLYS